MEQQTIYEEDDETDQVTSSGALNNSIEELVSEGIQRTIPIPDGDNLDLSKFPNVAFYYKLVAKV